MLLPAPMAIGAAIGSAARSSLDPVGPEGTPNFVLGIYFLNGKNIGNIGKNQFMALDIDPGKYTVSFIHNALGPVNSDNLELEVEPGSVLFVISEVVFDDSGAHAFIVPCTDKCVERVTVSHRVSASWPTNK